MRDFGSVFKGKKITVMGLGLLGRAVGDTKFLAEQGAELIVTDLKSAEALAPSLEILKPFSNITYRLGTHDLADFRGRDYILMAAGVSPASAYIREAERHGTPIKMSASWFAELAETPVIGVTGTRGKSTTTMMIDAIMRKAEMQVILGGNIRGVSTLALLPEVTSQSIALMELDSWQCRGFGDAEISPTVAVFTTFYPDHMNFYQSMDDYLDDKAQIFLHQKPEDYLIMSDQVAPLIQSKYQSDIVSHVVVAKPADIALSVLGAHNQLNAACALEAARAIGIDDDISLSALKDFKGVPGRLELIREVNGVKIYNDTTSTTPEATLAALDALRDASGQNKNLILILGGSDKGLDMSKLEARLPGVKKVVRIEQGLDKALAEAVASAAPGDNIALSPAYASFGMFKNEFDRGDQFNTLVAAL